MSRSHDYFCSCGTYFSPFHFPSCPQCGGHGLYDDPPGSIEKMLGSLDEANRKEGERMVVRGDLAGLMGLVENQ